MRSIYCVHCTVHSELHLIHLTKCLAHIIHTSYYRPLHLLQFTYITCVQFQQHSQVMTNLWSLTLSLNTFGRGVLLHCSKCYHLKFALLRAPQQQCIKCPIMKKAFNGAKSSLPTPTEPLMIIIKNHPLLQLRL